MQDKFTIIIYGEDGTYIKDLFPDLYIRSDINGLEFFRE